MRKPVRMTLTASMVAALVLVGVVTGPAANAAPRQMPSVASVGLLAPAIRFSFGGAGTIGKFGASVGVYTTYRCSATLDSPILPQLLGSSSSLTLQISEDIAHNGTQTITEASRTINDLTCNGANQFGAFYVTTTAGMVPMLPGPAAGVVTMRVCDLLGCTEASAAGLITLS